MINSIHHQPYLKDDNGNYWACYLFIPNSQAHNIVTNPKQAQEGGKLIGRFLDSLHDFPKNALHETLPNFHNIEFRLSNLEKAITTNSHNRLQHCLNEIEFVRNNAIDMQLVMQLGRQEKIPLRTVHNDTKFNNLLLDYNDNGVCVIDLDTVMPGYIHYDFSDAVRTVANSSAEDEKDLTKITFDMSLFAAFTTGFIEELKSSLTTMEIDTLAHSVPLMPFLHGTRFLTDYLEGDHYYKTAFPEHNLQRARAQFQLVRCMQAGIPEMDRIIKNIYTSAGKLL